MLASLSVRGSPQDGVIGWRVAEWRSSMQTSEQRRIESIRSAQRQKQERMPRFIDGFCPYYRERLAPANPLSITTQPRISLTVGDNGTVAVFSTLGL